MGEISQILPICQFDLAYAPTYNLAQFLRMSSGRVSSLHSGPQGIWNLPLRTTQQVDQEAKFASARAGDLTKTEEF
jgi:hypothetical protein